VWVCILFTFSHPQDPRMCSACQRANRWYTSGAHCRTGAAEFDIYSIQ
jgi:hypothetical protein